MFPDNVLFVNEIFGRTLQGEGPFVGQPCCFLRLGLCNLHCPVCDTKRTWDRSQFDLKETCPPRTADEVLGELAELPPGFLVLSGGEPMLWQQNEALHEVLSSCGRRAHVETNGTIAPTRQMLERVEHFSVSPKLHAMGGADPEKRRLRPGPLHEFSQLAMAGRACFKIVCSTLEDVAEAVAFADLYRVEPSAMWIMPEGVTVDELIATHRLISPAILDAGFSTTTRLQVLLEAR